MKPNQLKELLKHIILEVNSQSPSNVKESTEFVPAPSCPSCRGPTQKKIGGKFKCKRCNTEFGGKPKIGSKPLAGIREDTEDPLLKRGLVRPMGAVNVEGYDGTDIQTNEPDEPEDYELSHQTKGVPPDDDIEFPLSSKMPVKRVSPEIEKELQQVMDSWFATRYGTSRASSTDKSELPDNEIEAWVRKEREKRKSGIKENNVEEGTGSRFLDKVKSKLAGRIDITKSLKNEKTFPDGSYVDDMEDGRRSNRIAGLDEMTTSSAAGGQPGGTIQVPAWGTKNKLGSPKAIAATTKQLKGYKVVKSITNENDIYN